VSDVARRGSVLATEAVKDAAQRDWRWSFAGARKLKGVGEARLYRVRRDETS
jgi:class 3 adenylate cyclase